MTPAVIIEIKDLFDKYRSKETTMTQNWLSNLFSILLYGDYAFLFTNQ